MLRRRRHFYHVAFRQDAAIMNTTFPQVWLGRWNHFRETETKYTWDDEVLRMLKGDDNQFLVSWKNVSEVYFSLHVEKVAHWIAIEVSIPTWCINIYDSNHSVLSPNLMEEAIKPWCLLLPSLLWCSGMFDDHDDLQVYPEQNAKPFSCCRIPPEECPQTKTSGDCGMFAIKHIEHLVVRLPLDTVIDENIQHFRTKWYVDLFYQNLSL
ncbi:uncharacterized protein LOC133798262 [Humulus lupulus]|uniref:uncharacterized protein LOC133798262 n=1 Tax=Humulus lupulus TaxID=3486 RepID=UPI002B40A691|nr:uncharacterized protein LOC133798262 [Humulus lupulus]